MCRMAHRNFSRVSCIDFLTYLYKNLNANYILLSLTVDGNSQLLRLKQTARRNGQDMDLIRSTRVQVLEVGVLFFVYTFCLGGSL